MIEEHDRQPIEAVAAHAADQSLELGRSLLEEHSASFRWIMASLLTLNAAGLLSLKDFQAIGKTQALFAGLSFFLGIGCALLIAVLGQKAVQRMMGPVSEMGLYWRTVSITGNLEEKKHSQLTEKVNEAASVGQWPRRFGFASFACFGIGLAAMLCGAVPK